jgi:anti-sigma B factor antagonist
VQPFWRRAARTTPSDAGLRAVSENDGGECRVFLSGRITIDSSPDLRSLLLERLQSPSCRSLTADFCEVEYLDTSVVATLVEVLKSARARGKAFHLTGLRERPHYLLEATRLLHLFDQMNSAEVSQ